MSQPGTYFAMTTDSTMQRPQRFRDARGKRMWTESLEAGHSHAATEPQYIDPGFAEVEERLSQDEPQIETESEARARITREAVASLSAFEQRVFELTYGGGYVKSSREVASDMDGAVSYKTVQRAQDAIAEAVRERLAVAE